MVHFHITQYVWFQWSFALANQQTILPQGQQLFNYNSSYRRSRCIHSVTPVLLTIRPKVIIPDHEHSNYSIVIALTDDTSVSIPLSLYCRQFGPGWRIQSIYVRFTSNHIDFEEWSFPTVLLSSAMQQAKDCLWSKSVNAMSMEFPFIGPWCLL